MEKVNQVIVKVAYTGNNYSAYLPILPGCATTGDSVEEIKKNISDIVPFHLEGMRESHEQIPDVFNGEYKFEYQLPDGPFIE